MRRLDTDIHLCKALVIDSNPTSRSILVSQLRDFGLGTVAQCGRISDARTQLEHRSFDVVLCEHGFTGTTDSGQQMLDDLRRHGLLPLSTVFIMITSEATYARVAEAAESALDSYLLKPHTAAALAERLMRSRRRKKVLKDIFDAIEQNRLDDAAALCSKRFAERSEFWAYAAQIGAELLLNLNRHVEAAAMYTAVIETQAVPWARLGIARSQADANEAAKSMRTLETLITEHPGYVDAYDVMGRVQMEQGNFDQAMTVYRQAAGITPGSVARLQKLGMLAFYMGQLDEASRSLDRAVTLGISSKMFDYQTLVLLAFTRFRQSDTKGLQRCVESLAQALARAPESPRLQRFALVLQALNLMLHKRVAEALQAVRDLALQARDESFDIEAGCNQLSLVSLLTAAELTMDRVEEWVDTIGLRHCASKSLTELLVRTAEPNPPFADRIKACHQRIAHVSEQAMALSLGGDPAAAARTLLQHGKTTLNSKLMDTAGLVLQRHMTRIDDAAVLLAEVNDLRRRYASVAGRSPLADGTGQSRKAGGIALRVSAAAATAPAGSPAG